MSKRQKNAMFVKVGWISNGAVHELAGFMWASEEETARAFALQKAKDTGYKEGSYCIDLYSEFGNLIDTATVQEMPR